MRVPSPRARSAATLLLLAGLGLAGPGCAAAARARIAENPASAVPGERTPTAAELGLPPDGAVDLSTLLARAERVQPAVVQARDAVEAARARVCQAEAARLPQVTTSASASARDQSGGGGAASHRFASFGFDVSWLLFDFGRTSALVRNAAQSWLAAQEDERTAEVEAAYGVRTAYFELARQLELAGVAKQTVQQFEAHLEQVKGLVKVGKRIPYDETKAAVDLSNARVASVQVEDAVRQAQANLATAVGLAEIVHWTARIDEETPPVPATFEAAWEKAKGHRPSLAAALAKERAAAAIVDAQVAALYPSVSLGAGYGVSGSSLPLPWNVDIGPRIQWTPFDGFNNVCNIDEAVASLRQARASRTAIEQAAWLDLRTAWLAIEDARQRVSLTALTVKSAQDTLDLAQGRFEAGLNTSVELSDAQQSLAQAQGDAVQARADLAEAVARLSRAMGDA